MRGDSRNDRMRGRYFHDHWRMLLYFRRRRGLFTSRGRPRRRSSPAIL